MGLRLCNLRVFVSQWNPEAVDVCPLSHFNRGSEHSCIVWNSFI